MDKIDKLLEAANCRLKHSNSGIKIFRRGQKLSLRGMLPVKQGKGKKQQTISLGIYCNAAGIQSAEKQAQKLASQIVLKEFNWQSWNNDSRQNIGTVGYWVEQLERDYFDRRPRNNKSESTWKNDYLAMLRRVDQSDLLSESALIELILTTEPDTRTRQRGANRRFASRLAAV